MNQQKPTLKNWWGIFSIPQNHAGRWQIGPMSLHIRHVRQEWHIASESGGDPLDNRLDVSMFERWPATNKDLVFSRFTFRQTTEDLKLSPVLPDRAMVIRPEAPLYVLSKEEVTLYVSLPLWVRIEAGKPEKFLQEIPVYRPSDTWFGRSTREGELCYASRTSGRLNIDDVPFRPHRVVCPVLIRNDAEDPLLVERLNVSAPNLSLYVTMDGYFWTQRMILQREADGERVQAHFEKTAPETFKKGAALVCGPRVVPDENLFKRALDTFFA